MLRTLPRKKTSQIKPILLKTPGKLIAMEWTVVTKTISLSEELKIVQKLYSQGKKLKNWYIQEYTTRITFEPKQLKNPDEEVQR